MFKYYFEGIENIEIWPIISLILFLAVFLLAIIRALRSDKAFINYMKNLPFQERDKEGKETDENYEK